MVDGPNVYVYCNNDPVNHIDLYGLRLYIGGHSVVWGAGGHTAIILEVETVDEDYFKNDKRFTRNPYSGKLESDISAGPKNGTLTPYSYNLDRKGSVATSFKQIPDPKGRSDIQLFNDIFDSANKYKNNLDYNPFVSGDSYNSNSYTRGILKDVGIINPPLPDGLFYPGWTKPVSLKKP